MLSIFTRKRDVKAPSCSLWWTCWCGT
ncbi:hypothetical protein PSPO01_16149 [Paraphaeosphaeria sporulosa]